MKKLLKIAVLLCLCLLLAGVGLGVPEARATDQVASGDISANNIRWILWSDGELVFTVPYDTGSASIPAMSSGSTSEWLAYKAQIKTVTITHYENTNITSIGSYAFADCSNLTGVDIPEGTVTSISSYAFQNCPSLATLTLTDNITSVASTAFYGTTDVRVYVPTAKGNAAKAVSSAHDYYLTGDDSFALRCNSSFVVTLKSYTGTAASVTIPDHVDYLDANAFEDNTTITSVTIPASVTGMGSYVFAGCTNLATVTIANGLTTINDRAFDGCASLSSINIPGSVTAINSYAFNNCSSLATLTLTDNITSVASTAFYGTTDVRVYVPTVNGSAAQAVSNACNYYFGNDTAFGMRYANGRVELRAYTDESPTVTVPTYVEYICSNAFANNEDITSVTVPAQVTGMDSSVFANCVNLTTATLNAALTSIPDAAFEYCASLTTVSIPATVTAIGGYAFYGCESLPAITFPNAVTEIGYSAFSDCGSLASVSLPDSVTSVGGGAFDYDTKVYVPTARGNAAQALSDVHNYYVGNDNSFALRYNMYDYENELYRVELWEYTGSAASVVIPSHVDYIYSGVFYDDESITSVTIPSSVTSMGNYVFEDCDNLATVTLSEGLTAIPEETFMDCLSLTAINIPASVESIGENAFSNCSDIEITLPAAMPSLGSNALPDSGLRVLVGCVTAAKDWAVANGYTADLGDSPISGKQYRLVHRPATDLAVAPTCLETGLTEGSHCADCAFVLVAQETVAALGHDWAAATYVWNEAHTQVTATRVCNRDHGHVETETANATSEITTPATCLVMGKTTYTSAAFANTAFVVQVDTLTDVPALGHDWDEPVYLWNGDYSKVTASHVCKRDGSHVETETADATGEITTPATCLVMGRTTYTSAAFANAAFAVQAETVQDVPALGHSWAAASYVWNDAHTQVTATRVCNRDHGHVETEIANAASKITTPATCTEMGQTTYTSNAFSNAAFVIQIETLTDVPALGHSWAGATYVWNDAHTSVTATRVCVRDGSHMQSEQVNAASQITTPATCTEMGETTYTSEAFTNAAFTAQTVTLTDVPALGHDWGATIYTWNGDHAMVSAARTCQNDPSHRETETAAATAQITTPATCTEMGETTYTSAAFTNAAFVVQTVTVTDVPALGHAWGQASYEWLNSYTQLRATCVCTRDASHVETETVSVTAQITTPATCTVAGRTTYTSAAFEIADFSVQTTTKDDIPALGHTWATVSSVAADSEDGVRGGIACSVCNAVRVANRTVSARKILRVPQMMRTIDDEAFYGIAAEQAVIPAGTTALGSKAFANCDSLLLVVIPSTVITIADDAFENSDVAVICPDGGPAAIWCDSHHIPHNP